MSVDVISILNLENDSLHSFDQKKHALKLRISVGQHSFMRPFMNIR